MKLKIHIPLAAMLLGAVIATTGAVSNAAETSANRPVKKLPAEVKAFAAAKENQARELAKKLHVELSPDIWAFFNAVKQDDASKALEIRDNLRSRAGQYEGSTADPGVCSPVWSTVLEVDLAVDQFALSESKYNFSYGRDIIASIPAGSIYFGGTDPGRGLVTALSADHAQGKPFFTLTQNALADANYLTYLREMYGSRLHLLTQEDSQRAFNEYILDAQKRLNDNKLKPGEDVRMVDGKINVGGQISVMAINGLLAKQIFDKNPDREFFIEESFPLDWMYPHLTPNGLILKVNRKPLASISAATVKQDRDYWNPRVRQMVGGWLKTGTPVRDVCAFADKVFAQKNLAGFTGDPLFVSDVYSGKMYSKLRSSLAGLYAWRMKGAKDAAEKERMRQAADFAFRQAFAMCPASPEVVFRYTALLVQGQRFEDALLEVRCAAKLDPKNTQFKALERQLESKVRSAAPAPSR